MITTIASEMAFPLYQDVYGFFNLLGHYFKIVSFYLIYAALIKTNLKKPYESLVHEIDERKQAEEELREKTGELDSYFNNALDLFCIADTDGYFRRINKEWETTLGFKLEELGGQRFLDFVHPDDMESTLETVSRLEAQKEVLNFENRYRCQDGSYRWIEWRSTSSGKLIYAAARDLTERNQPEEKILKLNRVYAVFSQINQTIVREHEKDKILSEACRIAVEYGKFRMAWIGMIDEETHLVKPIAYSGIEEGYLSKIKGISIEDVPAGYGPTGTAIRESRHYVCDDIEKDPQMGPWRGEALKRGYRSSMALPIRHFGKVIGAFSLYASVSHFFDREEIHLLDEVTNDISFAIDTIETAKKKLEAEEELKKHREHLEKLVKERTAELEAKIAEIERMNRLFVGRELRMKELKEQIARLEKEGGKVS